MAAPRIIGLLAGIVVANAVTMFTVPTSVADCQPVPADTNRRKNSTPTRIVRHTFSNPTKHTADVEEDVRAGSGSRETVVPCSAQQPYAASFLPGLDRFVTSTIAGIATRTGRPLPGQDSYPPS